MSTSFALPSLPSLSSIDRPKRRLSNATSVAAFDLSDQEEDEYNKPRSKRSRVGAGYNPRAGSPALSSFEGETAGGGSGVTSTSLGGGGGGVKALSEKEKESRRQARMIRNRNAAQASRDRKKEHTAYLERRVAELESQLRSSGPHPLSNSASSSNFTASIPSSNSKPPRSQRSTSITSNSSSSDARMADLEDENDLLRTQLHLEQVESARLRTRLDSLEDKFAQLGSNTGTTTPPFPSFEPTFAFDTTDIKTLPQPEELAFVEERNRQKRYGTRQATEATNITQTPLLSSKDQELPLLPSSMNLDSSRLVAREVDFSLPRKLFHSRLRLHRPLLLLHHHPPSLDPLPCLRRSLQLLVPSLPSTSPRLLPQLNPTSKTLTTSLLLLCGTNGSRPKTFAPRTKKNRRLLRDSHLSISPSSMMVQ